MTDTRSDKVLEDLIEHPGWEELVNGIIKTVHAYRSKQQSVLNAKTSDEIVFQSLRCAAAIDALHNFVRNVYRAAEVQIPDTLLHRLRE